MVMERLAYRTVTGTRSPARNGRRKGISAIPVVALEGERITIRGIVTSTDLRRINDESVPVTEIMAKKVHVVSKDAGVRAAAKMMLRHDVHHLVVMDEGRIVGMISALDFVQLIAENEL